MDFLIENLDDLLEIILELIKLAYKFIVKKLIPGIIGGIRSVRHSIDMKKFREDLDIKKNNIKDSIKDLNEKL